MTGPEMIVPVMVAIGVALALVVSVLHTVLGLAYGFVALGIVVLWALLVVGAVVSGWVSGRRERDRRG